MSTGISSFTCVIIEWLFLCSFFPFLGLLLFIPSLLGTKRQRSMFLLLLYANHLEFNVMDQGQRPGDSV